MKPINRFITILILIFFLKAIALCQSGWSSQVSGTTEQLLDIQFISGNTGFAGGSNGIFLKTVNGGSFWSSLLGFTNNNIVRLFFLDANTGWIITTGTNPSGTDILKTTNGGLNFTNQFHGSGFGGEYDIFFTDPNNGWFCEPGNFGLKKTTNSGVNWIEINQPWGSKIFFLNQSNGFMFNSFELHKTTNNGQNWITITNSLNNMRYFQFFNQSTGYGVLGLQGFAKTVNGGNNWNLISITNNLTYNIYDASFNDLNIGWAVSYAPDSSRGLVYKTFNGGINWYQQFVGTDQQIRSVSFFDANTGWIAGFNGIIYKTTNGGGDPIGIQQISSEVPLDYKLSQNFPNPFNPQTSISFELPLKSFVKLVVYDLTGKEIIELANQSFNPGKYFVSWDAGNLPSGTYFYKLETIDFIQTKKLVLIK